MAGLKRPMAYRFKAVAGFVPAGGVSRRMGRPKALLSLDGETMIERQAGLLRAVTCEVFGAGWPANIPTSKLPKVLSKLRLIPDDLPGRGPLGGIYTGLKHTRTEYNLFLGCDMPYVQAGLLEYLCRRALETRSDVTLPKSRARRLNPVCAVYRRRALPAIRTSLEAGEYKISQFFPRVHCEAIPRREIARAGFPRMIFDNMNELEDYEAAKKKLSVVSGQWSVVRPNI